VTPDSATSEGATSGRARPEWPPAGATRLDTSDLYERLAGHGYRYGPAFRLVPAAWRRGRHLFAEIRLPEATGPAGVGIHPALLDAALHPLAWEAADSAAEAEWIRLPFSWSGIRLHAIAGSEVRVHLRPTDDDALTIRVADPGGTPVLTVANLALRSV